MAEGGTILSVRDAGAPRGTTVTVSGLFENVPARRKFLKSERTEMSHLWEVFHGVAIPAADLLQLDPQHLLGIVPFVKGGVRIQPFVALEPDQFCLHDVGQHFGNLGLAHTRLSFQQNGFTHGDREINYGGERPVANISLLSQGLLDFFNRKLLGIHCCPRII